MAGVDRSTLYRWRTNDFDFMAALNSWRQQALESASDDIVQAAHEAIVTVRKAIRKGNVAASLTVLKGVGTLAPRRPGPRDPDVVQQTLERDVNQEYATLVKDRVQSVRDRKYLSDDGQRIEQRDQKSEQKRRERLAQLEKQQSPPDKLNPDDTRQA
jgi:hypothetical protein